MRHRVAGRKLGRTSEHRKALLRNLSTALFDKEKITTTLAKAKELRPYAEKLVTLSKRETLHARRHVLREIHDRDVVAKLFDTLSARYAQRPGGYTRIFKLGPRRGDNAEMAVVELVDRDSSEAGADSGKGKRGRRSRKAAGGEAAAAESKSTKSTKSTKTEKAKSKATTAAKSKAKGKAAQEKQTKKEAAPSVKSQGAKKKTAKATARKSGPKGKG